MTDIYVRCVGLLVENDALLLMRYSDPELGDIWQYPGGGLQAGETVEDGVRREMREETGRGRHRLSGREAPVRSRRLTTEERQWQSHL